MKKKQIINSLLQEPPSKDCLINSHFHFLDPKILNMYGFYTKIYRIKSSENQIKSSGINAFWNSRVRTLLILIKIFNFPSKFNY